jgi:hypothetical protein
MKPIATPLMVTLLLLVVVACCLIWLGPQFSPLALVDQCDSKSNSRASAPIVVVGVLTSDILVRRPIPMHSSPHYPLQLRRLTLRVENVLKGAPVPEIISVYYFTWAGGFDGPRPLGFWRVGGRRILWLRMDVGVFRTVCDGWDGCTEGVASGAHPRYRRDPRKPLEYAFVDSRFTRGEGTIDETGFATELDWEAPDQVTGLQAYSIDKLRHLALTEGGEVKSSACRALWIYTVDLLKPAIHSAAENAMNAANCRCNMKADGNVKCQ